MGMKPEQFDYLDDSVVIDLAHHRRLGMHLAEYADRHGLSHTQLREMLSMIGL